MARAAATAPARRALPARRPARMPLRRAPIAVPRLPTGARLLDSLLRGRAWIALVGVLLVGIVFFNVDLLRVNRQLALTGEKTTAIERQNARLDLELSRLSSTERIQRSAAQRGMVLPLPGQVHFVRARPGADARNAAHRLAQHKPAGRETPAPTAQQQSTTTTPQQQPSAPAATAPAQTQTQTPAVTTPATPTAPTAQQQSTPPGAGTP